jgi:hypothetical protein
MSFADVARMMNTILFRASGYWNAVPATGEALEMNVLFNFAVGNGGAFLIFALTETTLSRALQTLATARAKWLMTVNLVTVGLLTGKSVTIVAAGAPAAKGVTSYVVTAEIGPRDATAGVRKRKAMNRHMPLWLTGGKGY